MCISNLQLNYLGSLSYTWPWPWRCSTFTPREPRVGGLRSRLSSEPLPNTAVQQLQRLIRQNSFKRQRSFAERVKRGRSELRCAAQPRKITPCLPGQRWRTPLTQTTAKLVESPSIRHNVCSFLLRAGKMMINSAWAYYTMSFSWAANKAACGISLPRSKRQGEIQGKQRELVNWVAPTSLNRNDPTEWSVQSQSGTVYKHSATGIPSITP